MMQKIVLRCALAAVVISATCALLLMGGACQQLQSGAPGEPLGFSAAALSVDAMTVGNINNTIYVDGVDYAQNQDGINQAIADAPDGGTVHMPAGTYTLSCSNCNTEVIKIKKLITLEGDGWGTVLQPQCGDAGAVDQNTEIIHVAPQVFGGLEGVVLRDFAIIPAADCTTPPGSYGILVDTQVEGGVQSMLIDHVRIEQLGSNAIASFNTQQDGFFTSTIQNSILTGGIALGTCCGATTHGAGDLLRIIGNKITGNGWGIDVNFEGGASSLIIQQNGITSQGGIHIGGNAISTRILQNEIEPPVSSFAATALIDVDGMSSGFTGAQAFGVLISGNSLQPVDQLDGGITLAQDGVRVNKAASTTIVDNWFERATGRSDVVVTALATNTIIGTNGVASGTLVISDSGSGTVGSNSPVKLDGFGSFSLAAEAACLASGDGDRFLTWSPGTAPTCQQACNAAFTGTGCGQANCVMGWSVVSGTTNYRYGTECDAGSGFGISGKLCCCTGSGCGQPMYR
jgi:hypothetical protein